jgi:iron(II)-dependent oxidoreductase
MARSGILLLAFLLVPAPATAQVSKRKIAVLEFTNEGGLTKFEVETLSDDVRGAALVLPKERNLIMTRESLMAMLPPGADLAKCTGDQCEIEAGRMVGADFVVAGTVGKYAGDFVVRLKLFDTRSAALLGQASAVGGDLRALRGDLIAKAADLFAQGMAGGAQMPAPVVDTPAPVPEVRPTGPRVKSHRPRDVTGNLTVSARAEGGALVRLEVKSPDGSSMVSGAPYADANARPGTWRVVAKAEGHEEAAQTFELPPGEAKQVNLELRLLGGLSVTGEPIGATVKVTGPNGFRDVEGGLPWEAEGLKSGTYHVEVSQAGCGPQATDVTVEPGRTAQVSVRLAPLGIEWVTIPGGSFLMGANGNSDERPIHRVSVGSFQLARTEVTVKQYRACVDTGACTAPEAGGPCNWGRSDRDDHPVNCVTWEQGLAFARWVGGRLPTEAEWEYAARSGGKDRKYPWGNAPATCERVVMSDGVKGGCGRNGTWPVCSKPAGNTEQGLCDLAGNVWEWVEDRYHDSYQGAPEDGSAWTKPVGSPRVSRGGTWSFDATRLRVTDRGGNDPGGRTGLHGFRVARTAF